MLRLSYSESSSRSPVSVLRWCARYSSESLPPTFVQQDMNHNIPCLSFIGIVDFSEDVILRSWFTNNQLFIPLTPDHLGALAVCDQLCI